MIRKNLHKLIEVEYKHISECPLTKSRYTFFQILYVISGEGQVTINNNKTHYHPGNLLLFVPDDSHNLEVLKMSEFLLIRFNKGFFTKNNRNDIDNLESLLYYAPHQRGSILKDKADECMIKNIVELILQEINNKIDNNHEQVIIHFVNALITIAARNIIKNQTIFLTHNTDSRIQKIILYLQDNIHCPKKLRAEAISKNFGISQSYLSNYFKTQSGETIQDFISQYRLRLIEHRLKFSDKRINEIVDEFGFSDESHLNKFFKRYKGMSLTGFRKQVNNEILALETSNR